MTPNEFEQWQKEKEYERELTAEEFHIAMDMLGLEDNVDAEAEYELDGLGVTSDGKVIYTNKEDIKYQKALQKQRQRKRFKIV